MLWATGGGGSQKSQVWPAEARVPAAAQYARNEVGREGAVLCAQTSHCKCPRPPTPTRYRCPRRPRTCRRYPGNTYSVYALVNYYMLAI